MPLPKAQNAAIQKSNIFWQISGGLPTSHASVFEYYERRKGVKKFWRVATPSQSAPNFLQSTDLVHPTSFPTVFEWPKLVNVFSSYANAKRSRSMGRSVRYIHTRASTGLVVNHCDVVMSPKGKLHGTWHVTPQTFFSADYRFGARGRNMLQWPPNKEGDADCVALINHSLVTPCTLPLTLVAPGIANADQRNFSLHLRCLNLSLTTNITKTRT